MTLAGGAIVYYTPYIPLPRKLWALGVTIVVFGVYILLFGRELLRKSPRDL